MKKQSTVRSAEENCQAVNKEIWVDKRRFEVIDSPYFHVVFTLPHELNPLIYCNQQCLYSLLHRCCSETLLELSSDEKYLGATPGIIQVLHTWNQELDYHVHMHCIVSGGGLTRDQRLRKSKKNFFIPVGVLRDKFKGKYLALLDSMYREGQFVFSSSCEDLRNPYEWKEFINNLYGKDWCPYIKETTFSARGRKPGDPRRAVTLANTEFIRRYLMHVLPSGFQKIPPASTVLLAKIVIYGHLGSIQSPYTLPTNRPRIGTIGNHQIQGSLFDCPFLFTESDAFLKNYTISGT